jgi:uncharacterized protein YndB with AHSA1/START domain
MDMEKPNVGDEFALRLQRHISAAPERVFNAWTDPALMRKWFTPRPWTTPVIETDVRPGGSIRILMRGPEGEEHWNHGVYLEVVPGRRLVTTDAYTSAWVPAPKPFMTTVLTFEPEAEGTLYTAIARHWFAEDKETHEKMGFHEGWGKATDQLEELLAR